MAGRNVYHVTKRRDGDWQGKKEGGERASVVGDNKQEVVKRTTDIAKHQQPSQVKIHKEEGNRIQTEYTYKDDPRERKG